MRQIWITLVLVAFVVTGVAVAPSISTSSLWVNVDPDDIRHGESEQTMEVFVEGVSGSSEFVVNVTPLAAAGVDLSGTSVEVDDPAEVSADASIVRTGEAVLVRVTLDAATDSPTDASFGLTLTGLETANANHTRLNYGIEYEDDHRQSQTFELANPDLPWVSSLTRTDDLVTGQRNASQHTSVRLDEVPAAEAATVRVDISALAARNVTLSDATVTARLTHPDQGADLRHVERNGNKVEMTLQTASETDVAIELSLHDLDTRNAEPERDLRYWIEYEGPGGSMAGAAQPFGLYTPGETPTATPPPSDGLTTTEPPTASPSDMETGTAGGPTVGSTPGFGLLATVLSLLFIAFIAMIRTS